MQSLILSFFVSVVLTGWAVHGSGRRHSSALDHDLSGPQKFHSRVVPRIGGVGILVGVLAGMALMPRIDAHQAWFAFGLLGCALPTFVAGLVEDFTKRVSPVRRLAATMSSAALAFWLIDAQITRSDVPGLDAVLSVSLGSFILTLIAVAGLANAVNIIDGFNGLASMCVAIMLAAIAYVAFQVGDSLVMTLCLIGIGAVFGFFVWNYPSGLIFLGDGGAYFLGFFFAELSILLVARNPSVSPLFPLLVCVYPVFETLFSMYRRRFLRAVPSSMADGIHLHSLIYRRLLRWAVGDSSAKALTRRNSMTSPFLWTLCMVSVVPAVLFWESSAVMAAALVVFAVGYVSLYWSIVRFRSPRWLRMLATRPMPLGDGDNRGT